MDHFASVESSETPNAIVRREENIGYCKVQSEYMIITQQKINCGYGRRNELMILQWN
jgi:hypothetical protein